MSRNLCKTSCDFCDGAVVKVEPDREITKEDCGYYFGEYQGMKVANAACVDCEAPYLAWLDGTGRAPTYVHGHNVVWPRPRLEDDGTYAIGDLSHRQSFNDEPGPSDYPKWQMVRARGAPWPKCRECNAPLRSIGGHCDASYNHKQATQSERADGAGK